MTTRKKADNVVATAEDEKLAKEAATLNEIPQLTEKERLAISQFSMRLNPNHTRAPATKPDTPQKKTIFDHFETTFDLIGGVPRLATWANAHPDKFYAIYAKLAPQTIIGAGDSGEILIKHVLPQTKLDAITIDEKGQIIDDDIDDIDFTEQ